MLTFKSLGSKGNLGNQLFQIASTVGIANKTGHDYVFPTWQYANYFEYNFPMTEINSLSNFIKVVEKKYGYHDWYLNEGNFDINGALQSEKYFDIDFTKQIFQFKLDFINPLLEKYSCLFDKKTIFISVRRGDFVYHPHYYQLPYKYYILALNNCFSDWKERNLIFMSDDIQYCKYHFKFLKNAIFLENLSGIEQLALGSHGKDFIISNSTFSWWLAWMGEKENSKIIRPLHNFRGVFAKLNDDKDFFPERWILFDYEKHGLSLKYGSLQFIGFCFQIKEIFKFMIKESALMKNKIVKRLFK